MGHMRANAENAKIVMGKVLEELAGEGNEHVVRAQGWKGMSRGGAAGITKVEGRGKEAVERVKWLFDGEFE